MSCEATCKKTSEMKPVNGERTVAAFGQKHAGGPPLLHPSPQECKKGSCHVNGLFCVRDPFVRPSEQHQC
ncbi:hypothetical protein DNTS_035852 [Danionella cerebrum]|uniref:Uncharacterized protein n=1 Tax=Danionella cerebrum TaxID=2873325 RepID=A0A553Q3L0_9TELE|nr:hypothetical protein DNTS_035852 [Danionella translucida]